MAAPHQQSFLSNPLAVLAIAFAVGILSARLLPFSLPNAIALAGLVLIATILAVVKTHLTSANLLLIIACINLGVCFSLAEKQLVRQDSLRHLMAQDAIGVDETVALTGIVDAAPEVSAQGLYLNLRVEQVSLRNHDQNASGIVALLIPSNNQEADRFEVSYGERVRVITRLNRSDKFRNPGVSPFTEYLERKGYDATGVVKSDRSIQRLDAPRNFAPLGYLYLWRLALARRIDTTFSKETAAVLNAAFLGNRHGLSRSMAERFRAGGTFHVLVISGLHITFLGGIVFLFMRRITRRRGLQFFVSAAVLWAYTFAVGAEASVVRAAFMFTFISFAPIVARRAVSLNALGAAGLFLLVLRPRDLLDPSFQLTFMSVAAIVVIAWPLLERLKAIGAWSPTHDTPYPPLAAPWLRGLAEALFWSQNSWRRRLANSNYTYELFKNPLAKKLEACRLQSLFRYMFAAAIVSSSVQLALLPFLIIYFHRLSLPSLVLNMVVGLLMAGLCIAALFALLLGLVSTTLATPLVIFANLLNWLMVHSVDPFTRVSAASIRLPQYTGASEIIYAVYFVPLLLFAALISKWNPQALFIEKGAWSWKIWTVVITQLLLVLIITLHPYSVHRADGQLRVDFLDVGQGDAAVVTMPNGATVLIDAGGKPSFRKPSERELDEEFEPDVRSIGDAVVSEYLWSRGLDSLDYVLATHADADHIDGLNDVGQAFHLRAALVGRKADADPEYLRFEQTMESQRVPIELIGAGDELCFGDVTARVLWPNPYAGTNAPSKNDDSIVLYLKFGDRTFLLTGDIEKEAEEAIVRAGHSLAADVLKVAHHGSRTSSTAEFVRAVHPRLAVISVGQMSIFGHPHKQVVDGWSASGAEVLTTGSSGTISVLTDGKDLHVETFIPRYH